MERERFTIQEASRRLRISESAIQERIQSGLMESEEEPGGQVYVYLDLKDGFTHDAGDSSYDSVTTRLENEISSLREELERRSSEVANYQQIVARLAQANTSLTDRLEELEAHSKASGAVAEHASRDEEAPPAHGGGQENMQEDASRWGEQPAGVEPGTETFSWRRIVCAILLAGTIPPLLTISFLVIGWYTVGYAVNEPPIRIVFLIFYFLVNLIPLPVGIWAGHAWSGRRLEVHLLLGLLAGATQVIFHMIVVRVTGGFVWLRWEDYAAAIGTVVLFLSGGLLGDWIARRRNPSRRMPKILWSTAPRILQPNTIGLIGGLVALAGAMIDAIVTLIKLFQA